MKNISFCEKKIFLGGGGRGGVGGGGWGGSGWM